MKMFVTSRLVFSRGFSAALLSLFVFLFAGSAIAWADEYVATVTYLDGKAWLQINGERKVLDEFDKLKAGSEIAVDEDSRLTLVYTETGEEYEVYGDSSVFVADAGIKLLSGEPPTLTVMQALRVDVSPELAQGGFVPRGIHKKPGELKVYNLKATKIADPRPDFTWGGLGEELRYHFSLTDEAGNILYETRLEAESMLLPENIKIIPEHEYIWSVSTMHEGAQYIATGNFILLGDKDRTRLKKAIEESDSTQESQIKLANFMIDMGLRDDANALWQKIGKDFDSQ